MNNPFEVESCILHRQIRDHASKRTYSYLTPVAAPAVIPPPSIFDSLRPETEDETSQIETQNQQPHKENHKLPNTSELAVHLELLEALLVLKNKVLKSNALDNTFGTRRVLTQKRTDKAWLEKRKEKWKRFVEIAVLRFEHWWGKVGAKIAKGEFSPEKELPPLDILMVWHTYMLNPGAYREDLGRLVTKGALTEKGKQPEKESSEGIELKLKHPKFPWKAIHEAISDDRDYTLTEEQKAAWKNVSSTPPDLFQWLSDYEKLHEETLRVLALEDSPVPIKEQQEGYFNSFYDKERTAEMELLPLYIRKDTWCLSRLMEDMKWIYEAKTVVPSGVTLKAKKSVDAIQSKRYLSVLFLSAFPKFEVLQKVNSLSELYNSFISVSKDPKYFSTSEFVTTGKPDIEGAQEAINWILSTYARPSWYSQSANSPFPFSLFSTPKSPNTPLFPIDLLSAVHRQELFVDKMGHYLWIRSPYVSSTLSRAINRYSQFTKLLKLRSKAAQAGKPPRPPVVPTLDIDLAWHTHQLDPVGYHRYCVENIGKFINHDDNLGEATLSKGWEWTKEIWWKKYGSVYGGCLCWVCEGVKTKGEEAAAEQKDGAWDTLAKAVKTEVEGWRKAETDRRKRLATKSA